MNHRTKVAIALVFATAMIVSGLGIMAFSSLARWDPQLQATPDIRYGGGGGGGGGTAYTYTWTWYETGLSSEISSWSVGGGYGSASPGNSISYSETTTSSSSPTLSWSWGSVPGYSVSGPTSGTAGSYTASYSGSPVAPSVSGISSSANPGTTGQSITFSASPNWEDVNGGTYHWSASGGALSSSTASNPTWSASSPGTYTIYLYVSTDAGSSSTISYTETVYAPLTLSGSISASPSSSSDPGQTVTFAAPSISGGSGGNTYYWDFGGTSESTTSASITYTFSSGGSYTVSVYAKDSEGAASNTVSETYTVYSADPSVSISPNLNPSDQGQTVVFTATASGGSGSYTNYNWYLNGNSVQSSSSSQLSYDFTSTGSYSLYVVVTDSTGTTATSPTLTQTVNTDPAVSISTSQNPTDVGKSVTFTASASGGTGSYSYQWYEGGSPISGATSSTYSPGAYSASGTYDYYVRLTDGAGYSVNSNTISETVNSDPTVSAASNVSSADVGYPIEFSSSPSGGTSPYSFSWTIGGTQVSTSQDFSYSFSSAGSYTVEVTVTDAVGETYSASVTVTINNNPSVSIASSQDPTDVGNSVTFTASESGGTGTISYSWYVNGVSEGSGVTLSYSFSSSGNYTIEVVVDDSDGHTASSTLTETVNPDPSVTISSSQNPTDIGNSVTFTASETGGTGTITYQWYLNGTAISGATSSTYTTSFSSSGTYDIYVIVTDGIGKTAQSSTLDETVNSDPSVSISSSQNPTDVGNSVTFTASESGGTGTITYQWYLDGTAISGATSSTYTTSFGTTGTDSIYVVVTDSLGNTAQSSTLNETVNGDPTVSISSSQNPTDVGNSVTFTASASGGTGSFSYVWYLNGATQSSTTSEFSTSFSSAGTYYVNVTVKDYVGDTASYSFVETVNPDPSVTVSSSPNPTDAGVLVSFASSLYGGTAPYNYTWQINSVPVSYASSFTYTFSTSGTYTVQLKIRDANGNTATATLSEVVNPDPSVSITPEYTSVDQGINDTFTANVQGGTYPFNYTWSIGSNIVNYSQSFHYAFPATGTYTITLTVKDSLGKTSTVSSTVQVIAKPSVALNGPNVTDVDTPTTFTGSASYGTAPYTFYWYVNGVNETSSSSGLYLTFSFTSSGTYNITLKAVDSQGAVGYAYLDVSANGKPSVSITASKTGGDVGDAISFSSSLSGGTAPYTYLWLVGGTAVGSGSSLTYLFNSVGTIPVELRVTDAAGNSATSELNVTIASLPQVSISAAYGSLDQGIADTFTASGQYGTQPFNFTWSVNGAIVGYGQTLTHTFTATGTFSVSVTLRDADGNAATSTTTVEVYASPAVRILSSGNATDVDGQLTFDGGVTGGVPAYNYTWYVNGAIVSYSLSLTYSFTSAGIYYVNLTVKDSFGEAGKASVPITVYNKPSVSVASQYSAIDEGQSDTFTPDITGGHGPYSYEWSISGIGVVSTQPVLTYTFLTAGTYSITVSVEDEFGNHANATITVVVNPALSGSISIQYPVVDENITDNITLSHSGGTGPYSYVIFIDGFLVSHSASYGRYFTSPGSYSITAYVNDSMGASIRLTTTITVRANPSVQVITPVNRTDVNVPVSFRTILSGGTGPYTYSWLYAGHTSNLSNPAFNFASAGNYTVQVTVTDAFGRQATASLTLKVYPDPSAQLLQPPYIRASVEEPLSLNVSGGIASYTYDWIFPNGEQFSSKNVTYAFSSSGPNTFQVKVTDLSGYVDVQNFTVQVHLYVAIDANVTSGLAPLAVQFSSSVLGGSNYAYNWSFGNGHTSLQQNPTYVFPSGNYTVHFSVTSANGATGSANISIESLPPPVSFIYSTGLNITQDFHFQAVPNWDAPGPYNMSWSFPNGQTLTGLNVSYKFPVYSELNTVIATFSWHSGTITQYLTVRMVPAIPSIVLRLPTDIPTDTLLSLNATASAPDSNTFAYSWDIGGTSESGQSVLYYFSHTGNYTVSVTVTDGLGATNTASGIIHVLAVGKNSSIAISQTKAVSGPMDYYTVRVVSSDGITAFEAFLGTALLNYSEINSTYTSAGEVAYFNVTLDQRDYPAGTYSVQVVVFNNASQSNSITFPFTVTSQYSSSTFSLGEVIQFFGGISNFIITILTFGGLIIAYASLRREDNPDVIVEGATASGKAKKIVLKGKK